MDRDVLISCCDNPDESYAVCPDCKGEPDYMFGDGCATCENDGYVGLGKCLSCKRVYLCSEEIKHLT